MTLVLGLIEPAVEEAIAEAQAPCEGGIFLRRKPIPISNELRGSIDEREAVVNLHHVSVDHHPLSYRLLSELAAIIFAVLAFPSQSLIATSLSVMRGLPVVMSADDHNR